MPDKFLVHRDDGSCGLVSLPPYSNVVSNNPSLIVTASTDPVTGQVTYAIDANFTVDINVQSVNYDAPSNVLTIVETDGTIHTVDLTDLEETTTTLVANPDGSHTYTSEDGTVTVIPSGAVSSISQVVTSGNVIASHDNGDGTSTDIIETNTTMVDNGDGSITYTSEDGTPFTFTGGTIITEGLGIDITGAGTPGDPYVAAIDLCDLPLLTESEIEAATEITVAGCVDGESVRLPYAISYPGPTASIEFTSIADCANTQLTMFANSNPACDDQGIVQIDWWITDASGTLVNGVNIVASPTFPLIVTVDLCGLNYPLSAYALATDACGQGGDASGNGLPAQDTLLQDLPIAALSIPSNMPDSGQVTLNGSGSTPSDGNPGGIACPQIDGYEFTITDGMGAVFAVINTPSTGTAVTPTDHPLIIGGTAESPIVNLDGVAGDNISVSLLVTDCNGTAGEDAAGTGSGNPNTPATASGYVVLCEAVSVRDTSQDVLSEVFTENDFSPYTILTPLKVFQATANGNGSLGGSIIGTFNLNDSEGLLATGNSRIRLEGASSANGQITLTFNRIISVLHMEAFDVDVPGENLNNFSPGTVTSITPPFGNMVSSNIVLSNINSNVVTFNFTPNPALNCVIDINRVETQAVVSSCFSATKCTQQNGAIVYTRDSNGAVLNNSNIEEC